MRGLRAALLALVGAGLVACSSGAVVSRGGGSTIAEAQAEPGADGTYRIAVGRIIDKSGNRKDSVVHQLGLMNARREQIEQLRPEAVTEGVRDMLVTELFGSKRFIVLERADLDAVLVEQEFANSARAGDATRIPLGQLEGAELIVLGAITSFDAGTDQVWIPIPFTFGDDDIGVANLRFARGSIAMDLRVIDARTGRVLSAVAVEGSKSNFAVDVDAYVNNPNFRAVIPKALTLFKDTPIEEALQKMVIVAVHRIAALTRPAGS